MATSGGTVGVLDTPTMVSWLLTGRFNGSDLIA
jgi:hypothetical protein